jgi:hypothetical protein
LLAAQSNLHFAKWFPTHHGHAESSWNTLQPLIVQSIGSTAGIGSIIWRAQTAVLININCGEKMPAVAIDVHQCAAA